jgi:hypothetical protein
MHQSIPHGLFCLLANRAGIEENQIGLLYIGSCVEAILSKNRRDNLAIREVHLAAITLDVKLPAIAKAFVLGYLNSLAAFTFRSAQDIYVTNQLLHPNIIQVAKIMDLFFAVTSCHVDLQP